MANPMEGEEVQFYDYVDGKVKKGIIKNGVMTLIKVDNTKKGETKMATKKKKNGGNGEYLKAWREAGGVAKRRPNDEIVAELKSKRKFYADRLASIDHKIRYYDNRMNAERRKELLAQLTTEQLEKLVASLKK